MVREAGPVAVETPRSQHASQSPRVLQHCDGATRLFPFRLRFAVRRPALPRELRESSEPQLPSELRNDSGDAPRPSVNPPVSPPLRIESSVSTRGIRFGEELTFDYACVSESKEEFASATCLCGSVGCRGSFVAYADERSFMQVVDREYGLLRRVGDLLWVCVDNGELGNKDLSNGKSIKDMSNGKSIKDLSNGESIKDITIDKSIKDMTIDKSIDESTTDLPMDLSSKDMTSKDSSTEGSSNASIKDLSKDSSNDLPNPSSHTSPIFPPLPPLSLRQNSLATRGLKSAVFFQTPPWVAAWAFTVSSFLSRETDQLPAILQNLKDPRGFPLVASLNDAIVETAGVSATRLQNLAISIDRIRHFLSKQPSSLAMKPPLHLCSEDEILDSFWFDRKSVMWRIVEFGETLTDDETAEALFSEVKRKLQNVAYFYTHKDEIRREMTHCI